MSIRQWWFIFFNPYRGVRLCAKTYFTRTEQAQTNIALTKMTYTHIILWHFFKDLYIEGLEVDVDSSEIPYNRLSRIP